MEKPKQKLKRTSVDLTPVAQKIKEQEGYLGLKNIISAGLVLYACASITTQSDAVQVANDKRRVKDLRFTSRSFNKINKELSSLAR